tara:strand:- start:142 stop:1230 length:1089 start_codon:yes stop_codon:yes gene_type:complete
LGQINKIELHHYRNFKSIQISFIPKCNVFFGDNGTGKTNLLECISLLSKGRGFRNANIKDLIYKNENKFIIESEFEKDQIKYNIEVNSEYVNNKYKKIISLNNEFSNNSSKFIDETISFLFFLPEMERLFIASPSYRRNFLDRLIFSENKNYNKLVNKYKKNLMERSKILQMYNFDESWIDKVEFEISKLGLEIYKLRENQILNLNNNLKVINKNNKYPFNIKFEIDDKYFNYDLSQERYLELIKGLRDYDCKFGGSKIGPHKSDIKTSVDNDFEASLLSTGQQKTLVLMMLIAQCNYLINIKKIKPIFLFDEICSHLDKINREILLDLTQQYDIQFFLTGTEKSLFSFMSTNTEFYNIKDL